MEISESVNRPAHLVRSGTGHKRSNSIEYIICINKLSLDSLCGFAEFSSIRIGTVEDRCGMRLCPFSRVLCIHLTGTSPFELKFEFKIVISIVIWMLLKWHRSQSMQAQPNVTRVNCNLCAGQEQKAKRLRAGADGRAIGLVR